MIPRLSLIPLCLVALTFCCDRAGATLGEPAASVARDSKAFSGTLLKSTNRSNYRIQSIASGTSTTTVREFVAPTGVVFAVAWNGLVHPDLKVLLGSYDPEYRKALSRIRRQPGRQHSKVVSDRLVVETWGHMRNLQGRAYLPGMLPEGVSPDEIR